MDYSRPFNSEWHFIGFEDGLPILETDPAKFPFSTDGGVLRNVGECLHAEERLAMIFGGDDHEMICADWFSGACQRLSDRRVKLLTKIDRWRYVVRPEAADTVFVTRCGSRPAPAVFASRTERLLLEDVIVHASPGMGIISQLSGDITIRGSRTAKDRTAGAMPREGFGRLTPLQADATHFSNCRGKVTVENCTFERMCDDAINVHSTCLRIGRLSPPNRLVATFMHKQAKGFELFAPGEAVRFIRARTMDPGAEVKIRVARLVSPDTYEIELADALPTGYVVGDAIENADWQPEVRFANNIVNRNVSRAALFTTPRRVVCEGNRFVRVGGSAIKLSGDSKSWFETGGCRDVVIRNNSFINCRTCSGRGVIVIDPEIAVPAEQVERYHRNIVIEGNRFDTHDIPLIWAKSVSNLVWRANCIVRNELYRPMCRKPFHFEHFDNVTIDGVKAERHPEVTVSPEHTFMLLVSGHDEVAGCESELNDIAERRGVPFCLGNAQGRLADALWNECWEVVLLDESEVTCDVLKMIKERAPKLKIVIQTRKTTAVDWPQFETIAVGCAVGPRRAEILAHEFFDRSVISSGK